jgi:hypothetical protein
MRLYDNKTFGARVLYSYSGGKNMQSQKVILICNKYSVLFEQFDSTVL